MSGVDWADRAKVEALLDNPAIAQKADSLAELSRKVRLPADRFARTIAQWNSLVASGEDTELDLFSSRRAHSRVPAACGHAHRDVAVLRRRGVAAHQEEHRRGLHRHAEPGAGRRSQTDSRPLRRWRGGRLRRPQRAGDNRGRVHRAGDAAGAHRGRGDCRGAGPHAIDVDAGSAAAVARGWAGGAVHDVSRHRPPDRDTSHRILALRAVVGVGETKMTCVTCHAEMSPFRPSDHKVTVWRRLTAARTATCPQPGEATSMTIVGRITSLWRYPVKSMRGEPLQEAFAGFSGVYGDRVYTIRSAASPKGFPYFTGRDQGQMLRYQAAFRHPDRMAMPPNLAEAQALGPGITPLYADIADLIVDVTTPAGDVLAVDNPRLLDRLREGARDGHQLSVLRSERALTDCRPFSLSHPDGAATQRGTRGGTGHRTLPRQRVRRPDIGRGLRGERVGRAQAACRRESGDRGHGPRPR